MLCTGYNVGYCACVLIALFFNIPLHWRHYERDCVSNHQPRDCLRNRLFSCRSKKTSKLRVTGLCEGNSSLTGEFPTQRASNVSIWWRHHAPNRLRKQRLSLSCKIVVPRKKEEFCAIISVHKFQCHIIFSYKNVQLFLRALCRKIMAKNGHITLHFGVGDK